MQFVTSSKLTDSPFQRRQSYNEEQLKELANDIRLLRVDRPKTSGLIHVPIVRPHPTEIDLYQIAEGHRRKRAFIYLAENYPDEGWEQMPVEVQVIEDSVMRRIIWSENAKRADLSPYERALFLADMRDQEGMTIAEISEAAGITTRHVGNLLSLLGLPEEIQQLADVSPQDEDAAGLGLRGARAFLPAAQFDEELSVNLARRAVKENWPTERVETEAGALLDRVSVLLDPVMVSWDCEDETLPKSCTPKCIDCPQHQALKRSGSRCADLIAHASKVQLWEQLFVRYWAAQLKMKVGSYFFTQMPNAASQYALDTNCENLCVGWYSYANPEDVGTIVAEVPQLIYGCQDSHQCQCRNGASATETPRGQISPADARLHTWLDEGALAAQAIRNQNIELLESHWITTLEKLDKNDIALWLAVIEKQAVFGNSSISTDAPIDEIATALANATLGHYLNSPAAIKLQDTQDLEKVGLASKHEIVAAHLSVVDHERKQADFRDELPAQWVVAPQISAAQKILVDHPDEALEEKLASLLQWLTEAY